MGFLNSLLLFGLLGSLVPLVIHLLQRRKVPRIDFPSLRFLHELNRRQMRRINLHRLLLLLLRMLLVALIAFALARPTLLGPLAKLFPEDTPRAVALLIDNSASMNTETNRGTLIQLALERADQVLDGLSADDEVLLFALEEQLFDLGGGALPVSLARDQLRNWNPGQGGTALRSGIAEAMATLNLHPAPQRELYILSDFAEGTLDSITPAEIGDLRIFALPLLTDPPLNAGLSAIRMPARPVLPGRPFKLEVAANRQGSGGGEGFPVELELGGKHRGTIQMNRGSDPDVWREMTVNVDEEGVLQGVWRKSKDRYPLDDQLHFTLPVASRLGVLLLNPPAGLSDQVAGGVSLQGHLERALDPYRGGNPEEMALRLKVRGYSTLASSDLEDRHLALLAGGADLGESQGELLADWVSGGGGLIICPAENGLGDLARQLLPRLQGPRSLESGGEEIDYLAQFDPEHPLFNDFTEEHRQVLGSQPLWRVFRTRPGERAILARFRSGRPAIISWDHGEGRVLLLLFEAGPAGGELPYSSMFLPLIQEMVQDIAGGAPPQQALVGGSLSWLLAGGEGEGGKLQVLDPDGRILPVRLDGNVMPPRAVLARADRAGFYRLQERNSQGVRDLGLAAVRVPPGEGELKPLPPDSLAGILGLPDLVVITADEPLEQSLQAGRYGREITRPLLFLAALLMIIELWVGRRESGAGRNT